MSSKPTFSTRSPLAWLGESTPYLLPPELPESQLEEPSDYAMSFVERNDYDLIESLLDLNKTVYQDYAYVSGSIYEGGRSESLSVEVRVEANEPPPAVVTL